MKKLLIPLSFFFIGIGASYFYANHLIGVNKTLFKEEVTDLVASYKAGSLSYSELQRQNDELNGKIFQLLFAYFGIDLRDLEMAKINNAKVIKNQLVVEKVVEKIVYVEKKSARTKVKKQKGVLKKSHKRFSKIELTDLLRDASPILEKDQAFDRLNKTSKYHSYKFNGPKYDLVIENDFKLSKKSYQGVSKVNYSVLGKVVDSIKVDGIPLNFLKSPRYKDLVIVQMTAKSYAVINTNPFEYDREPDGLIFKKKHSKFVVDAILSTKRNQ
ncbi:hypothetical protein A9Q84_10615 [Halobacteriovorax marinus]|uniref:Uncharacterized protein n=1 Tax=Halobacteriovorax marinus TaxID=97084 RepID=A0A1Y5F7R9_9BACT|nr:hypothetical protein A9Q84_10615 [Halobacteriovorax marinus]